MPDVILNWNSEEGTCQVIYHYHIADLSIKEAQYVQANMCRTNFQLDEDDLKVPAVANATPVPTSDRQKERWGPPVYMVTLLIDPCMATMMTWWISWRRAPSRIYQWISKWLIFTSQKLLWGCSAGYQEVDVSPGLFFLIFRARTLAASPDSPSTNLLASANWSRIFAVHV